MRIGGRAIGVGQPPYVIAEIGVNHDGSADRALELVRAAAGAGADAVKFQFFETDRLLSRAAKLAQYQAEAGESDPVLMLRRLELPIHDLARAVDEAHRRGLHAILSIFSVELVSEACQAPWDAYKTASPDIVNKPLLQALARTRTPLIVSTGAAELAEIDRAVAWVDPGADQLAVLQCVSSYPTCPEHASLGGVTFLVDHFRDAGLAIGYSDHTLEIDSGALAVTCGASLLERHLTHRRCAHGPDHAMSLEPDEFREYTALARTAWRDMQSTGGRRHSGLDSDKRVGPCEKRVLPIEREVQRLCRQSVVARRRLLPGHRVTAADVTLKRPGTGLPPYELSRMIGCSVAQAIEPDIPIHATSLMGYRPMEQIGGSVDSPAAA